MTADGPQMTADNPNECFRVNANHLRGFAALMGEAQTIQNICADLRKICGHLRFQTCARITTHRQRYGSAAITLAVAEETFLA